MTSIEIGLDPDGVPDACTLPTVEQPLRLAEFDALFASVRAAERSSATRGMLTLTGEPVLRVRVQDLAERETACCSFFSFDVTTIGPDQDAPSDGPEWVRLSIVVPEAYTAVLDALVDRAVQASR